MKKFVFRLQTVLKLRQMEEEQRQRRVGALQTEIAARQNEALEYAEEIRRQGVEMKGQIGAGQIDRRQMGYYQGYVTAMRKRIADRIARVREIQQDLAVARAELAEAARKTKTMEKLKEKQKQRYDQRVHHLEAQETDEIGKALYYRRQWQEKQP